MARKDISNEYQFLLTQFSNKKFSPVKDRESLFQDEYQTEQQSIRDELISNLLDSYVNGFKNKQFENSYDRKILKRISITLMFFLVIAIIGITIYVIVHKSIESWTALTGIITALITLCGSLFSIINLCLLYTSDAADEL